MIIILKVKKKLFYLPILIYCILITFIGIKNPKALQEITIDTLKIWLYKVFPPIFIFYVVSSFLLATKIVKILVVLLKPLKFFLKFESEDAFELFITSILVGNPSSSYLIMNYYNSSKINKKDASVLLSSASFITILFIFSIYTELKLAIFLYFSHILSSIILISIKTRKQKTKPTTNIILKPNFFEQLNLLPTILLNIACLMIVFNSIIYVLKIFNIPNEFLSLLEIGNGINLLKNTKYEYFIISFLISFNGLSIIIQGYNPARKIIKLDYLVVQKLIHGFLGFIIFSLIYLLH